MSKLSTLHILCLVLAAMMLLAVVPWPYGYYVLVRFVAMVVFGYMAYSFYSNRRIEHAIIAGVLALLFQPFIKVALGREVWQVVDVIAGIGLIGYVIWDRKHRFTASSVSTASHAQTKISFGAASGYDVFISYATKDYFDARGNVIPGNVLLNVQNALTNAGISYWIDQQRLIGGTPFPTEIARQIKNAKVFLYISSANSNASNWTMNEIATANTYGKPIIPLLADHTPYNPSIMIYIAGIHYIDYSSNPNRALNDLVHAIKAQIP